MPRPSPILLVDVMGTLVHDPFDREVPGFFGMTQRDLLAAVKPGTWEAFERGEIDEATLAENYFADGRSYDHAALVRCMRAAYRWLPGMEALVRDLARAGHALHVLSNYPCWWKTIEEVVGVSRYLPWTFVSCNTGVRKPDAAAFLGPTEQLGVDPGECLFVDDREVNCAAAREVGMPTILFEDADALRRELAARGVS
jgi:HAD superfamily hydrolase (TIGR01509 family)